MSEDVLGYYGERRAFHCVACGPHGLSVPVETATIDTGLDYARERCARCGEWIDEDGIDE